MSKSYYLALHEVKSEYVVVDGKGKWTPLNPSGVAPYSLSKGGVSLVDGPRIGKANKAFRVGIVHPEELEFVQFTKEERYEWAERMMNKYATLAMGLQKELRAGLE